MRIRSYEDTDEAAVIGLWTECGLVRSWNNPKRDIERKLTVQPELFLIAESEGSVVGTVMAGFDGHRGSINYLAVANSHRHRAIGRALMNTVEQLLIARGCPKLNLLVRSTNTDVVAFYEKLGYARDEVVSMGRRLIPDE